MVNGKYEGFIDRNVRYGWGSWCPRELCKKKRFQYRYFASLQPICDYKYINKRKPDDLYIVKHN